MFMAWKRLDFAIYTQQKKKRTTTIFSIKSSF